MAPLPSQIHLHDPTCTTTTSAASVKKPRRLYLIYFIPGNPGLIAYYTAFLTHLYAVLSVFASHLPADVEVFGRSLRGFEVRHADDDASLSDDSSSTSPPRKLLSLQEQIEYVEASLSRVVARRTAQGRDVRVVLIGHSVGSYIMLEVMRRRRAAKGGWEASSSSSSKSSSSSSAAPDVRLVGAVGLFATVVNLAGSSNGRKVAWLRNARFLLLAAGWLCRVLTVWIPMSIVRFLVFFFTGFTGEAVSTTAEFIKSPLGIRESFAMLYDELHSITVDKWDEEIWGAAHSARTTDSRRKQQQQPGLFFLFAKEDHWVANETRDALIKARGEGALEGSGEVWKPRMEVDEVNGWPHAFCVRHSVPVAERVKSYVKEMMLAAE